MSARKPFVAPPLPPDPHPCCIPGCTEWGAHGYGLGKDTRWVCFAHKPAGERYLAKITSKEQAA